MFRYLIFIWDPLNPSVEHQVRDFIAQIERSSEQWIKDLHHSGLAAFHVDARASASELYFLPRKQGVVFGKIFRSSADGITADAVNEFTPKEEVQIVESKGLWLIQQHWGRYVAVVRESTDRHLWVLRDPSGALPCFTTRLGGVRIVFSDINDCSKFREARFSINWKYVAARLSEPMLNVGTSSTGLNEVAELRHGERMDLCGSDIVSKCCLWNPLQLARERPIKDLQYAATELRTAVQKCVRAWSSCYPRIIHLLSGGFDSSVVLSCLTSGTHRSQVTCLNYFDEAPHSDERKFARLMAARSGTDLIEAAEDIPAVTLESILDVARTPVPWSYLYFVEHSKQQGQLAKSKGATAIFSGTGGDQIFYQNPVALAAGDYLRSEGLHSGFFQLAVSIARMQGISVWSILGSAVGEHLRLSAWTPLKDAGTYTNLASKETVESVKLDDELTSRWRSMAGQVPRGKLLHALGMACSHEFYDPLGGRDFPDRVRPLVSQPIMELCLRMPTYILTAGGWDRAVARFAFRNELPSEISVRRAKGAIDTYLAQLFKNNLAFVRELMLDGVLVRNHLLDKRMLEIAFQRGHLSSHAAEIVADHLSDEVWLRGWANC